MEDTRLLPPLLLIALFLLPASLLCAQNNSSQSGYHIDYSGNEPRFVQRLEWDADEYALHYELEIQVLKNAYETYRIDTAKENFIELSLPPGQYRFNVTTYDLLARRTETSDWMTFTVIAAFQPRIERVAPEAFFMDQKHERILHIAGAHILNDSVIYLKNEEHHIFPLQVINAGDSRVRLIFDDEKLIAGNYNIVIENPGGLNFSYSGFIIGYKKPMDVFMRMALVPAIPIYGEIFDFFGPNIFLLCSTFGFEAISSKRSSFNGGLEVSFTTYMINNVLIPRFNLDEIVMSFTNAETGAFFLDADVNLSFQKRFHNMRSALTFRAGGGLTLFGGYGELEKVDFIVHLNTNVTAIIQLFDIFYLDVGVDCSFYFSDIPFGLIKPRIGFVWQF